VVLSNTKLKKVYEGIYLSHNTLDISWYHWAYILVSSYGQYYKTYYGCNLQIFIIS